MSTKPPVETIYALSSGSLPCGVAVIRLSGPQCLHILETFQVSPPKTRQASVRRLLDCDGAMIDEVLVIYFEGPNSFTGEDVLELHCHGSKAVIERIFLHLSTIDHVRLAEIGEFSKRAFLSGRLSLLQAEGLVDLIHAETESQRKLAVFQAGNNAVSQYQEWRTELVRLRSFLEAEFDFPDEEDIPDSVSDFAWDRLNSLANALEQALERFTQAEKIREGYKVALIGEPNAGKSSLLNQIVKRDIAIVTPIAGTTRDVLEASVNLNGMLVRFFDMAGLRETDDQVERMGIEKAKKQIEQADLILHLMDSNTAQNENVAMSDLVNTGDKRVLTVVTKEDLIEDEPVKRIISDRFDFLISNITSKGLPELLQKVGDLAQSLALNGDIFLITRERHRQAVSNCLNHLQRAMRDDMALELRAEELRLASSEIGQVTGAVTTDDLLDVIFRDFCVGK